MACTLFQSCSPTLKLLHPNVVHLAPSEEYAVGSTLVLQPSSDAFRADVLYRVNVYTQQGSLSVDAGGPQSSLQFSGTYAQVSAAASTLRYTAPAAFETDVIYLNTARVDATTGFLVSSSLYDHVGQIQVLRRNDAAPNQAPMLNLPVVVTLPSHHTTVDPFPNPMSVFDPDALGADLSIRFKVQHGKLQFSRYLLGNVRVQEAAIKGGFYLDSEFTLIGDLVSLNAYMSAMEYVRGADSAAEDFIEVFVSDLGNMGSGGERTAEGVVLIAASGPVGVAMPIQTEGEPPQGTTLIQFPAADPINPPMLCDRPDEVYYLDMTAGKGQWYLGTFFNVPIYLKTVRFLGQPSTLMQIVPFLLPAYEMVEAQDDQITVMLKTYPDLQPACEATFDVPTLFVYQNQPPRNVTPGNQTVNAGGSVPLPFNVTDPDVGVGFIDVRLRANAGVLNVTPAGSAQVTGNGSAQVDIKATIRDLQNTLRSVVYVNTNGQAGQDVVSIYSNDRGNNGAGGQKTDYDEIVITINAAVPAGGAGQPAQPAAPSCTGAPVSLSGGSYTCDLGTTCSFAPSLSGGQAPYSWSYSGSIPPGMSFSSGTVSGTISGSGSYTYTVTVTDCAGNSASANMEIFVGKP
jgi:hypothetical protein